MKNRKKARENTSQINPREGMNRNFDCIAKAIAEQFIRL